MELAIRTAMTRLGSSLLEQLLGADTGHRGQRIDCGQGHCAWFVGYRDKNLDYRAGPGPVAPRLLPLPHLRAWDGAPWIWNLATAILPEATPIVDLYHARQHVHDLAGQLAPALGEHHSDWLTARLVDLDSGDIETLVQQPIGQHTGHT